MYPGGIIGLGTSDWAVYARKTEKTRDNKWEVVI